MQLQPGTRLGPYEIATVIGAGGMGEVYRARDTGLKRDVAVKVLPDALAGDADRLTRFRREAEALAALNHPNIAQIYGVERSGETPALILELVEGPTLADRIATGPIPLDDALPIGRQIADALAAAHERGIIHRDLKPANVKVKADGTVKVLDFGLAKAIGPPDDTTADAANSPTLTARATELGIILGTAAYMSPEQARGKAVDRRADVWAFGAVLYEMLTGRRAFRGDDVTDVLAAVIRDAPDLSALPAGTPSPIRRLLRRCFEKDRANRLDSMRAAQLEIRDAIAGAEDGPTAAGPAAVVPARSWWRRGVPLPAVLLGLLAAAAVALLAWPARPVPEPVSRFEIGLPPGATPTGLALTPDGRSLVYSARMPSTAAGASGTSLLYRRDLDRLNAEAIRGSDGADGDVITWMESDGPWAAFRANHTQIKKIRLSGGPAVLLTVDPLSTLIGGLAREPSGHLIFGMHEGGLRRVPSGGGPVEVVTKPEGTAPHRFPQLLPDGRSVLFTIYGSGPGDQIAVLSAGVADWRVLTQGSNPQYVPTGHLIFIRERSLWAAPFDAKRFVLTGDPVPVVDRLPQLFEWSGDGTLFYGVGGADAARMLVWVDRKGVETPLAFPPTTFNGYFWLSPDGRTLLSLDRARLWLYDLKGGTTEKLTTEDVSEWSGIWSADGRDVIFMSRRTGPFEMYRTNVTGTRSIQQMGMPGRPIGWMPDKIGLLYRTEGELRVWKAADQTSAPLLRDKALQGDASASVSPDGRFVAYEVPSDPPAIVVRPLPDPNANRWLIPASGTLRGIRWSFDGRELFYRAGTAMMSVPVAAKGDAPFGAPRKLFDGMYGQPWEVARDGRFLMVTEPPASNSSDRIIVVRNWFDELKKVAPVR